MIAYEFYWLDDILGVMPVATLPERRKDPSRITPESIMNMAKKILGDKVDTKKVFYVRVTLNKGEEASLIAKGKNKESLIQG